VPTPSQDARSHLALSGENVAAQELQRLGFRVVARNYHCRGGEADIVAFEGETLVFVEVKTRSQLRHGLPREAVGWTKQQRLARAAEHYVAASELDDPPIRFDVVEVVMLNGQIAAIELIRDAFVPESG
jgi:putative endonuclease